MNHDNLSIGAFPGAWGILMGLLRVPVPIAKEWWHAILASRTPALAPVPFWALGQGDVRPTTLLKQTLRLWSGDGEALTAMLTNVITPAIMVHSCEDLCREGLFTRQETTHLQELIFQRITADGDWK